MSKDEVGEQDGEVDRKGSGNLIKGNLNILEAKVVQGQHHNVDEGQGSNLLCNGSVEFIRRDDTEGLVASKRKWLFVNAKNQNRMGGGTIPTFGRRRNAKSLGIRLCGRAQKASPPPSGQRHIAAQPRIQK